MCLHVQLKAIEELKEKQGKGEVLEKTQLKKIETEGQVRAEIAALGGDATGA
jgi:translation initiation factor 2A